MPGNHPPDWRDNKTDNASFLTRWSARKAGMQTERDAMVREEVASVPAENITDADLPALESLGEDSDYSGFLLPGVSETLHRHALRKLFGSTKYAIRDGLDDYDADYNLLQPLRAVLIEPLQRQVEERLTTTASDNQPDEQPPTVEESQANSPEPTALRTAHLNDEQAEPNVSGDVTEPKAKG